MEQEMKNTFILNALEDGWTIKKKNNKYIFTKKHENETKYFSKSFLNDFIMSYIDKDKIDTYKYD